MPLRTLLHGEGTNAAGGESVEDALRHDIDLAEAIDLDKEVAGAVHVDQRPRLASVDLLAVTDRLLRVIRPPLLDGALAQPGDNLVLFGDELDDGVERLALALKEFVEVGNLVERAGVTVEQKAVTGVFLLDAARDERVGQRVGHVVSRVNDRLDLDTERRLASNVVAEDVAGRDGRDAEASREARCLGSLAGTGRADDQEAGVGVRWGKRHRSSPS